MKKLIIILCILGFCINAFADNTERIKELQAEAQVLQKNLVQYNQTVQNIQVRLIEIRAILSELEKQEKK